MLVKTLPLTQRATVQDILRDGPTWGFLRYNFLLCFYFIPQQKMNFFFFPRNSQKALLQNESEVFGGLRRDTPSGISPYMFAFSSPFLPCLLLLDLRINNTHTHIFNSDNQRHSHLGYYDEQCTFYVHGVIII